jgi:NADPH2:quinone reductase
MGDEIVGSGVMRAAILREYGGVPEIGEMDEPAGTVADVLVAGLNPIDLRIASGQLAGRERPLPYVVGSEGVASLGGRRVYFDGGAALAERVALDPEQLVGVPDGVEDGHAVAYGIAGLAAWLALEKGRLAEGETVLILGASGTVGMIGVQVARLMGAGKVIAAARSKAGLVRATELGADATVRLDCAGAALTACIREAAGGDVDLVLDPLWGPPAAAAVEALAFRGRLVQLGQSAGALATFPSVAVRFGELSILGHTNFAAPFEARRAALERMFAHAAAGELVADFEELPLDSVGDAWRRQAESPNVKLVLRP